MKKFLHGIMFVLVLFQSLAPAVDVAARQVTFSLAGQTSASTPTPEATQTTSVPPAPTEIPTESAAPAPTIVPPTESALPVPAETLAAAYSLELQASPAFVSPGGQVNLRWRVNGAALEGLALLFRLPAGVTLQERGQLFSGEYRIAAQPTGSLQLQVDVQAVIPLQIEAQLLGLDAAPLASANLTLFDKTELGASGGSAVGLDGRVKVTFPQNALQQAVDVVIGEPQEKSRPAQSLSGHPFEITAYAAAGGGTAAGFQAQEISQFDDEIQVEVNLADSGIPLGQDVVMYFYNEVSGNWEALPSRVDWNSQTLIATTTHFTVFDYSVHDWQAGRLPSVDAFQVSGFTGAGTYSYPISLPAGPGGFQPSLALSYNSQMIDQATSITQASWVGMGWSLDTGVITRNTRGSTSDMGDDSFSLTVNGVSSAIVQDAAGIYHLADENFWKVEKLASPDSWVVKDKTGNTYYFEYVAYAAYQGMPETGFECGKPKLLPYEWHLTRMRNVYGQEISYAYTKEQKEFRYDIWNSSKNKCVTQGITQTDTAVYPATINYPNGRYRVRFELAPRTDYNIYLLNTTHEAFMRQRLSNIYVEQDADGDSGHIFETVIRRYALSYAADSDVANLIWPGITWSAGGKTLTLRQVREYGEGGTQALPATVFSYGDRMHLTQVENGYGGKIIFTYQP